MSKMLLSVVLPSLSTRAGHLKAGDFISAENIELIDVIKELNCRKNKLLIGAIESALKSLRMGGASKRDQFRGLVRPVSQRLSRVA